MKTQWELAKSILRLGGEQGAQKTWRTKSGEPAWRGEPLRGGHKKKSQVIGIACKH